MIRRLTLIAIFAILIFGNVFSQKYKMKKIFHLEAKSVRFVGSSISNESDYFKPSLELGLGIQYPLTSRLNFSPQLTLSQRGFNGKKSFIDSTYSKRNITTQYLDVSPNFEIKLGSLSEFGNNYSFWGGGLI